MRVKIVAHFHDDNGNYDHAELTRGVYADVRDHIGELWAKNGWAIIVDRSIAKEPESQIERAVIETPEDNVGSEERETTTVRRRGRPPKQPE